jgi:hemolysin III
MAGAAASIAGLTLLVVFAALKADVWHVVSFSIFGATLVLMYTSSSLYHGLRLSEKGIAIMRKIDHITIFMLIAGTYTPFCLVPLRGPWGWTLLTVSWSIALAGAFLKLFCFNVPRWISTAIYLIMGWIFVVAVYPLVMALNLSSLIWLALGGLFYSGGAVIYALKRPNPWPNNFGFHGIWHLFVLSGSFCHFWAVFCFFN